MQYLVGAVWVVQLMVRKESLVKARLDYKKAIKVVKNEYKRIREEKLHQALLNSDIKKVLEIS